MATKPEFDVVVLKNVMVPMRDGVHLAADVYLPHSGSPRASNDLRLRTTHSGSPRASDTLRLRTTHSGSPRASDALRLRTTHSGSPRASDALRLRTPTPGGDPARAEAPPDTPRPALLERTPYSKDNLERVELNGLWYAERGYAVMIQDVRGRYRSEGTFSFLPQEAEDGYDTIEWVARQPWCNGKVGTLGLSYAGWTQVSAAALGPPHLAALWVDEAGANAWTSTVRHNGAFEMRFLCWAFWQGAKSREAKADPVLERALGAVNVREWLARMPLRRGASPLALLPAYEEWALAIATRGDWDAFWEQPALNIESHWDRFPDCPMVFLSAWYDSYTRANLENFVGLAGRKRGPIHAIMGPWTHGVKPLGQTFSGDVEFGPEAALDHNEERLAFFDAVLKGTPDGRRPRPPLRLFVMGGGSGRRTAAGRLDHGGRWRDEREWPLARTRFTEFYLHPGGRLAPVRLTMAEACTRFVFDPRHPVPTIGGNMSSLVGLMPRPAGAPDLPVEERERDVIGIPGAFDQREDPRFFGCAPPYLPLAARADVLVWQTEPLERDVEVTGPVTVTLWVSSDAPDTDITAKLIDVYPPGPDYPQGFAMNVTDSILRLRYRNGGRPEPLQPGTIYRCVFALYPTANLFRAGHRIRLDISSSNYPRFDVNPNTGDLLWASSVSKIAVNTIHHDIQHPSHVTLPLIAT